MRERGLAQALLDLYGTGETCLPQLCEHPGFSSLAIYEPGTSGRHRSCMKGLKRYRQSCYRTDLPFGEEVEGLANQDLQRLTFNSGSFDLVITSDILEHVRSPNAAFQEIKRVLKPGGRHVFTIPLQYPMRPNTVSRVDTSTAEDRPLLPPVYHGDGGGGKSLVYTDFGKDVLDHLDRSGMTTTIRFVDATNVERRKVIVLVSRKST
ncbi:MAG: class I SAM-dependent methyltransferase [Gammaproteobacteria bacterium]|nr:class I SAM-dependent methyltransferase [Gammaproteobacteria bacterium]